VNNNFICETHLVQLKESAISLEVAQERGYRTVMDKAELASLGFVRTQLRVPGLLIPQWGVDGIQKNYQIRPDSPRGDKNGKALKYENPVGSTIHLDCPPRCQKMLANPLIPLWITEGSKKADALASKGACALSLIGVWGFKGKNEFGAITMLCEWDFIALKDRFVYLAFDSDIENKKQVKEALQRLAQHLKNKGAVVQIIRLPNNNGVKVGIDDYLAGGHGLADVERLIEPYEPEIKEQKINRPYVYYDGSLYLQVRKFDGEMVFAFLDGNKIKFSQEISIGKGQVVVPQSLPKGEDGVEIDLVGIPDEGIKTESIVTPSELLNRIKAHISKYVDLKPMDLLLCCYYILFSWFFKKVNTLGYLRFIADTGKGKSRAQRTVGDLCFYPFRTSGASSFSGMARTSQKWRGTLVMDEADLNGDTANQVIKFLNLGFEHGQYYVLSDKENPRNQQYFDPFMPKVIAMRKPFQDNATEGRLLSISIFETNNLDIPILLPVGYPKEVQTLRNAIARFVLEHWNNINPNKLITFGHLPIEPRLKQLAMPLSIIFQLYPEGLKEFETYLLTRQQEVRRTRSMSWEGTLFNYVLAIATGESDLQESYPEYYENATVLAVTPTMIAKQMNSTPKAVTQGLLSIGFAVETRRIGSGNKKPRLYAVSDSQKWAEMVSRYYFSEDDIAPADAPEILRGKKYIVCHKPSHLSQVSPNHTESEENGTDGTVGTLASTRNNDEEKLARPATPCYSCGGNDYWLRAASRWGKAEWVCASCHPNPHGGGV
jgi:hypothetical protein